MSKKNNLFEVLNSIMFFKKDFYDVTNEKQYNSFMINKWLSDIPEYSLIVNEVNKNYKLPKKMQYDFLTNILPKKRLKLNFTKENKDLQEELKIISQYYEINEQRAYECYKRLSKEQFEKIKKKVDKGIKKFSKKNQIWF